MPKKNKRKFFGGKSSKSKSAKLDEELQQNESDSEETNTKRQQEEEAAFTVRKTSVSSSVTSDSALALGQLEFATSPDTNVTKMGGTMSCAPSPSMPSKTLRWCSEPNLNNNNNSAFIKRFGAGGNQKATITLKVIQFIGEIPKETRDIKAVDAPKSECMKKVDEIDENESMADDNVQNRSNKKEKEEAEAKDILVYEKEELGTEPKLDHFKEDEANEPQHQMKETRFDDNYRVESPKQISSHVVIVDAIDENQNARLSKRHAMLIQEISESSSSEEVKQFLDNEACAIESINSSIMKIESPREYRVESPESSLLDDDTQQSVKDETDSIAVVNEITESSSNESVKNDIQHEPDIIIVSRNDKKVINIKELPSESSNNNNNSSNNNNSNDVPKISSTHATQATTSTTKIKLFECKSEKKLNKAEEAIIEALYGNSNLLQIPNRPLDVISEEGSDCSDIERQALHDSNNNKKPKVIPAIDDYDEDEDDDVFLSSTIPNDAKYHRHRILQTLQKQRSSEQPKLINTKIIETESNVPESCKSWETKQSDSELQAELVYLTSTSSSATDLSERSDTDDVTEDTSEDTETNSLLENITVPSLSYNMNAVKDVEQQKKHEHVIDDVSYGAQTDYYQEINEQKLPDILEAEEDEEQQQSRSALEIMQSQQQIEEVNKELHQLVSQVSGTDENSNNNNSSRRRRGRSGSENVYDEQSMPLITADDKRDTNSKSGTPTPTQTRRKYSSDSSTSSSNSQCTIIRQILPIDNVHALKDLCMQSISSNTTCEGKITVQKKFNSLSRNAPNIPIINELEMHYECDNNNHDLASREKSIKSRDKVITILQVPPEMNSCVNNNNNQSSSSGSDEKERWYGMQSSQMPNLMVALSPLQKDYINTHESTAANADVLLDMHKKFVERRAYHEEEMDESSMSKNSNNDSQFVNISNDNQLLESNLSGNNESASDLVNEQSASSMDSIRNLIQRESAAIHENNNNNSNNNFVKKSDDENKVSGSKDDFHVKKYELESELRKLDDERKELEEELKNIQSLQHFKREEFLYTQKKLEAKDEDVKWNNQTITIDKDITGETSSHSDSTNNVNKYVNDDFSDFINSNEKLHKEIYNEWQDKVCERNERKLNKMLKITSINDDNIETYSEPPVKLRERAASERIVPLNDEFIARVKERQKRLSLPLDDNLDASTESLLNDGNDNDGILRKRKKKIFQFVDNKENFPAHFREFIEYCEQEIVQSKNSVESGESYKKPLYIGLIGVALCICGFYIGKHFLTTNSKFSQ